MSERTLEKTQGKKERGLVDGETFMYILELQIIRIYENKFLIIIVGELQSISTASFNSTHWMSITRTRLALITPGSSSPGVKSIQK